MKAIKSVFNYFGKSSTVDFQKVNLIGELWKKNIGIKKTKLSEEVVLELKMFNEKEFISSLIVINESYDEDTSSTFIK